MHVMLWEFYLAWLGLIRSFSLAWIRLHCSSDLPVQGGLGKEGRKEAKCGKNRGMYGKRGKK